MQEWQLLVIEDDADGQEVVHRMLQHHGINSVGVGSGEEALHLLEEHHFTGVIIDLHLPGIDGWRLLQAIRSNQQTADLPCVAITAFHSVDVAAEAIDAGFQAYFPKPLQTATFIDTLKRVMS